MSILVTIIIGAIVGALAKLVIPGKDPGGILVTMLLGVAGSIVASLLGGALGLYHRGDAGPGIIPSIVGSIILLALYRAIAGRRAS